MLLGGPIAAAAAVSTGTDSGSSTPSIHRTWLTFGLDRVPWLRSELLGNPIWQYLASLLYIILAFYGAKVLDYALQVQLRRWAARTKTRLDDLMVELLHGPVKIITFVLLLHVGLRVFSWPEAEMRVISTVLKLVVAATLTYLAIKFVDLLMGVWQQRVETAQDGMLDMHLFPILRKTFKIFVIIVAVLVTSQNLGMNVTGLLASLSIGGLAVGLAAQDTLSNLFGAVAIFADKPFRVGDRIQLDSIDGNVEAIGLRSTRVRNLDGYLVSIPNKNMASANIINVSKRPNIKTVMNIGLTYDLPSHQIERAMQIIEQIYRPHPKTADLLISFNKFESSSLNILVVHWWNSTDFKEYLLGFQKLNLELKRQFDEASISFAFPSQTVYLRQDSQWRIADANGAATATETLKRM
ncbi:MAG TPA: mechanosensitive ion channel family protein [Candidatus Limnocylindrales bacterium]|nr:mechanosensitive ion channel family protein [Candidatus Limnocylindrales bacterium]